ncbi:minor capsid protein [Bacillus sp. COPE52]|uniref:minor capsid protein n=1 Tax=Bacillus sp. COPE52 TaxID=2233998 RepID=UPI000E10AF2B|nr:minor capsid protein [Bacillus sp. COPE52]AXK19132.1 phage head morphogenesis protein [Bacillus sp. COPE52]
MNTEEYWQKRTEKLEQRWDRDAAKIEARLKKSNKRALKEVEAEMRLYLTKKGFDYNELMNHLDKRGVKHRQGALLDFLNELKSNESTIATLIAQDVQVHLDMRKLSRLDAIISEMLIALGEQALRDNNDIYDQLKTVYTDTLLLNKYDFKRIGIETPVYRLDEKKIQDILSYPWTGANFSTRIWNNKRVLINALREELVQGVIQGLHVDDIAERFAKRMDVPLHRANAAIYTESAYMRSRADMESFEEAEIEKYKLHVTFDRRTSPKCRALDASKIYLRSEISFGENYPPLHVRCRTMAIPHIEGIGYKGGRWVRDKNDKSVYVDNVEMTFKEYKEQFLR